MANFNIKPLFCFLVVLWVFVLIVFPLLCSCPPFTAFPPDTSPASILINPTMLSVFIPKQSAPVLLLLICTHLSLIPSSAPQHIYRSQSLIPCQLIFYCDFGLLFVFSHFVFLSCVPSVPAAAYSLDLLSVLTWQLFKHVSLFMNVIKVVFFYIQRVLLHLHLGSPPTVSVSSSFMTFSVHLDLQLCSHNKW